MFEGLVSHFINKYLGKYVQNLDSSNLNVSIFKGDVELTDLQLRPEALVELKLPVEVKAGYIGYIKVDIPWTSLFSASVVVNVEDVYILAGPVTDRVYDPERERALQNAVKRELLETLGAPKTNPVANPTEHDPGFLEKLSTYVVNNLQISIGRVHVRYEDTVTNPDHPFACGIMLKHISAYTTDSKWQPAQMDNSSTIIHKLLEMRELSVYWNPYIPEQHLIRSRINTDGWRNLLKQSIMKHSMFEEDFDFIIEPVSAETKVIISKDNNLAMPKFFADISLAEIEILLSRQQFLNVLTLKDSFQLMSVNQKYRKYHPNVPLKISPRSWWMYAYTAVVEERIRPYSWERIKEHRARYRKYKELYKKSLELPDHESIKAKLWELEENLDVGNIVLAREQAKAEFAPEKIVKKEKKKGWWASWFGSDSEEEEVDIVLNDDSSDWISKLTPEEKAKLYQGIGYDENANVTKLPKEYIEYKAQVNLKSCCLSLVNYSKKILQVSVTQMLGSYETRPAADAYRLSCHTESFTVEGASIEHDLVPIVTSDVNVYAPSVNQVFTFDFESKPIYVDADFSLKTNIQPVEVVYDEHSICEVRAFFQLPTGTIDMKTAAMETMQEVVRISQAGLIYAIQKHKTVHLAVNMKSPYVVIPEFGTLHRGGNVLIVDLGMLQIKSELQPKDYAIEHGNLSESEIAARLYDQFNITITDVKVLLADSGDDWHTAQIQPTSEYHILPSMKLMLDFYNTVKPDYKQLPQQKIITTLPSFEINISDKKLLLLWKFVSNFPIPSSTSLGLVGEDMVDGAMSASYTIDRCEIQLDPGIKDLRIMKQRVLGHRVIIKTKKQPKSPPTIIPDEADHFYGEDETTENWDKYEDIKAVDDISSTHNTTNMMLRVVVREVVIQLSKSLGKLENPYLMFRAERLRLDAAITEHGIVGHASLGAIQLVDKIHVGTSGEYMELLSTKPGTDLVSVLYRKVEGECPDFEDIYHSVEQSLRFQFETLYILADQGAIMYLKAYIEGVQTSLQSTEMVTSMSTVVSSLVTNPTTSSSKVKKPSEDQQAMLDDKGSSVVLWNIIFNLHDVSLVMADNNSKIAEIHIRDLHGHMLQRPDKLTLTGSLRDIDVKDCTHGALYPNILMLEDKEDSLFRFSFTKFSQTGARVSDNRRVEQQFDYTATVRVGHLQLVALGKFYWEIRKFLDPLLSDEVLDTASVSMKAVTKQVGSFQQDNRRFGINIDMLTPTILIPVRSDSTDLLYLKSGDLHVQNVFDMTDIGHHKKQEWNHIYVSLSYMQLSRAKLSREDDAFLLLSSLLEPMTFQMDIRLALEPELTDIQTDIACKLEKIQSAMSQRDCQVLFGVLRSNWSEGAPLFEQEPVRRTPVVAQSSEESGTVVMDTMTSSTAAKKTSTVILFELEGMELLLNQLEVKDEKEEVELEFARLMMGKISGTVNTRGDGETKVTVALETLGVINCKPYSRHVVKKILYYDNESADKETDSRRPLVSVIYKISGDGNQKIDIMMEKVVLNVQIPYMKELLSFFTEAFTSPVAVAPPPRVSTSTALPYKFEVDMEEGPVMTLYFSVSKPEIVLLADPESHNSRVIVVNADIAFEYVTSPCQQKMWSKISSLKMFSSIYGAPSDYQTKMISPCDVEFNRCYDIIKNELGMSVKLAKLHTHLTPSIVRLLLDVTDILKQSAQSPENEARTEDSNTKQEDLWQIKSLSPDPWINKYNEEPMKAPTFGPVDPPTETLIVDIEEMCAFFEVENMDQSVPLLCFRTSVDTKVTNWSKQIRLIADLELDVCYYNVKLSVWEPLIEPNLVTEGLYSPWILRIQMFQAQSFPIVCSYDDNGLDVPDGVQADCEQLINHNHFRSSSSEGDEDIDSPSEMTILRPKAPRRKVRITSDKSYESLSRHSSIQGESDSENESLIHTITNKLGSIFTTDSSEDADVSETDDNEEGLDWTLDKPIFLTPQGPVKFRSGPERYDEIDGIPSEETGELEGTFDEEGLMCNYLILSSPNKLMVNVTPPAISIIRHVLESLDKSKPEDLMDTNKLPALEIYNKLGVDADIILHKTVKIHEDFVHGCHICHPGDMRTTAPPSVDDINIITEEEEEEGDEDDNASLSSQRRPLTFVNQTLADAGHTLVSAGAFVFDDDIMSGAKLDRDGVQIQVSMFDTTSVQMMNRACRKLIHLTPKQHGTKYYMVYNVDMTHGNKTLTLQSPLQLKNNLTMSVDVLVLRDELQTYRRNNKVKPEKEDFTKLTTLSPQELFAIPLFAAYHCALYICPSDLPYEKTSSPIWWPDLVQTKDRQKYFSCKSQQDEKLFNIKVVCEEGEALQPPQMLTRTIPYFTITLHPPVVLHNYLPYDLQFSLQGCESSSSLTHGDSTPLYTVNMTQAYKLNLFVADYLTCDWKGTLDITQEMEEFKAISMDTDLDPDNNNKHLSLSVHCNHDKSWNFYIYSPYWIVNKTDLTFAIRGSMSDVALECQPASYPQLFRYKKNKRKKAKLKVFESNWSHAFSMDTVGNCGVVECHDSQRRQKYTFMVQCQLSKLKLTKIITVLPFFLVVNSSSKPLRYMEENKATDLWFDLAVGQCSPFWPVTESYSMFVKFEKSNIVSQHFPFKTINNTVLRMPNGSALCVGVSGGTQTPITIQFTDYDVGDAPVRVDNFCDDVFIKINQKGQSQTTILSANQSVLYTWDDPTSERTLMWNIYGRNKPSFPAAILKDGYDQVNLKMKSLKSSGTVDYVDAPADLSDSSPEDDSDEVDGLLGGMSDSLVGKTRSDKLVVFWVSYLHHQQRVLLFTQDERVAKGARRALVQGIDIPHERGVIKMNEAEQASLVVFVSLDGLCVSMMNRAYEEVALLSLTSAPATWEVEVNNRWKMLNVELQTWLEDQWRNKQPQASLQEQFEADLSKMQMLKPYMGALRRSYSPGLWFNYRGSKHHMSLHAKVQKVQLDNQLQDAYFPTVLHPCPTPVYIVRKKGHKPFIEVGMMRRTVPENDVDTFRYLKVLVQEFNIKIDKGFMMSMYEVFAQLLADEESESAKVQSDLMLTQKSLQDLAAVLIRGHPNRIFFEYLRLSPLKMHVSFSLHGTAHLTQENKPSLVSDIVDFFLTSVGATFTEMKDVELKMAFYEVKGMGLTWQQLSNQIQAHYTHQAIQQAYVLILGLDVLGNPYGLIKDFTQGFGDLFYEPFLDSVQGSDEFAESLVRGVHSMLGNTVGGAAGSVARITGSLGSALAALSLDKNYKIKRRAVMQQRPANLPLSLALAGRGFVMGVCLGLSGVVLDPIRGAQEEGVEGFFKGVGKGIMGLLTKPTGGVFDMVSMAFDGLQRAAELENSVVHRMRKPRFINPYLGLRPYSVLQAVGANLLLNINKGQYAKSDLYWAHAPLSPADRADVLLITTRHILLLQKHRCWGGWDIEWEVKVENILGFPSIVNNKLVFKVRPEESSMNIFTGGEQEISCEDIEVLRWIQQRIENLMKYKQR